MEIQEILNAVASVGFPIVACCVIFYLYDMTIKSIVNGMDNINQILTTVLSMLDNVNKTVLVLQATMEQLRKTIDKDDKNE